MMARVALAVLPSTFIYFIFPGFLAFEHRIQLYFS